MNIDLLYPNEEAKSKKIKNTGFYEELGFGNALFFGTTRLFGSINEENHITDYITTDTETIKYRLDIFDDFINNKKLRSAIEKNLPRLVELVEMKNNRAEDNEVTTHLYSLTEMDIYFDTMKNFSEGLNEIKGEIKADAIKNLADFISEKVNSAEYKDMQAKIVEAMEEVKNIKSVTIGVNLDAQLRPKEAGIVSVNSEPFKSGNLIDKILRMDFKNDAFFCQTPLEIATKNMTPDEVSAFFMTLDSSMDAIFKNSIKKWHPMVKEFIGINTDFLIDIVDQLNFYMAGVAMIDKLKTFRLKVCKPEIHKMEEKTCHISGLYNPLHAIRENLRDMATNSIVCDQYGQLYILTGSSKSGKSMFTKALGVAQVMFQLGMYVPADNAALSPVENLFAQCPDNTAVEKSKTKVEEECAKIGEMVKGVTADSMVIIDDILQSASAVEASYILTQALLKIGKAGARGVVATSLTDIADNADDFNKQIGDKGSKIDTLITKTEHDRPVFVIERERPEGVVFAKEIASKYGIA